MARKKPHEEHENAERWLVSYADFITLLFAFFTVLFAMGQTEKGKMESATQSIRSSFLSGGGLFSERGDSFLPNVRPSQVPGGTTPEAALDRIAAKLKPSSGSSNGGETEAAKRGSEWDVERTTGGLLIQLDDEINFEGGRTALPAATKQALEALGTKIRDLSVPIEIRGYAGRDAFSSDTGAWKLAIDRAAAVAKFMAETVPFFPERVKITGTTVPKSSSGARHRRVELFLEVSDDDVSRLAQSIGG
jgi:chemotaxis protein MotB